MENVGIVYFKVPSRQMPGGCAKLQDGKIPDED